MGLPRAFSQQPLEASGRPAGVAQSYPVKLNFKQRLRSTGRSWLVALALLAILLALRLPSRLARRLERAAEPSSALLRPAAAAAEGARQALAEPQSEAGRLRSELALLKLEYRQLQEAYARERRRSPSSEVGGRRLRSLVPAGLLARDPSLWFKSATLDVGQEEGVQAEAGVLSREGVVGRVAWAGGSTSRITLLSDPSCRLAVRLPRSQLQCAAAGDGRRGVLLQYLGGEDDVRVGDLVETAAGGASFPSGVAVGVVTRLLKLDGGLRLQAEVKPAADLTRLGELFVTSEKAP